jgi:hypothetical protein
LYPNYSKRRLKMTTQTADPYSHAMEAKARAPIYWGGLLTDAQFVVLEKGIGAVPYIEGQHPPNRMVTAIEFSLLTISEMELDRPIERRVIAEFGEWQRFVRPSIEALGFDLRDLNNKFVKIKLVETGKTYDVKDPATGQPTGEKRPERTFKFLKVFENEEECIADYMSGKEEEEPEPELQAQAEPQPVQATQPTENANERNTAEKFLKVLIQQAAKDQTDLKVVTETLAESLKTTPLVAKYFNVDSEETQVLLVQEMGQNA